MTVALSYFTVVQGNFVDIETSTATSGQMPTSNFVLGVVTFTPSISVISNSSLDATVFIDPIEGRFTSDGAGLEMLNGTPGVKLVDNVGLGLTAGQLTYQVDYWLNQSQRLNSFSIIAPGNGSTIDLNNPANQVPL